jgi:hypothetical protein
MYKHREERYIDLISNIKRGKQSKQAKAKQKTHAMPKTKEDSKVIKEKREKKNIYD